MHVFVSAVLAWSRCEKNDAQQVAVESLLSSLLSWHLHLRSSIHCIPAFYYCSLSLHYSWRSAYHRYWVVFERVVCFWASLSSCSLLAFEVFCYSLVKTLWIRTLKCIISIFFFIFFFELSLKSASKLLILIDLVHFLIKNIANNF